jgi:hypothetical protein
MKLKPQFQHRAETLLDYGLGQAKYKLIINLKYPPDRSLLVTLTALLNLHLKRATYTQVHLTEC